MLILIIGRWMLPKGDLTRDQLSQLLLVYIGTAADIIEFFDSFKEDRIAREPVLVYLTLGIWAWSLTQFTVVLTATKSRKSRLSSGSVIRKKVRTETSCCSIDVWGIALNMILQDGPFLAFRLILIIHYQIVSYMNIFFTCKNTLVILLQLYRLYVVQTENKSKRNKKYSKRDVLNINTISRGDMYKDVRMRALRDNNKYKNRYDKDIEANYSETEDSREDIDKFDLSPKNIEGSKSDCRRQSSSRLSPPPLSQVAVLPPLVAAVAAATVAVVTAAAAAGAAATLSARPPTMAMSLSPFQVYPPLALTGGSPGLASLLSFFPVAQPVPPIPVIGRPTQVPAFRAV
ncbi:TMM26 protein, partial [Acromyrmex insinuator]